MSMGLVSRCIIVDPYDMHLLYHKPATTSHVVPELIDDEGSWDFDCGIGSETMNCGDRAGSYICESPGPINARFWDPCPASYQTYIDPERG